VASLLPHFAITGGVGTGKSTALAALVQAASERGLPQLVFDADAEVQRLLATDLQVGHELQSAFPEYYQMKEDRLIIDRPAVRRDILPHPPRRKRLEEILHAPVLRSLAESQQAAQAEGMILWADIPLLYEIGVAEQFTHVIVVACSETVQRQRLADQRGLEKEAIEQFLAAQWPLEEKIHRADFLLWNDGSQISLIRQCRKLVSDILPASACGGR
jgi:dephospho-CoA kinase